MKYVPGRRYEGKEALKSKGSYLREERVNMKLEIGHMSFPATQLQISGTPACRKRRSHMIDIEIPVLVNSRPIRQGEVLIMQRGIKLEVGEHLDGETTQQQACARQTYVRSYVRV